MGEKGTSVRDVSGLEDWQSLGWDQGCHSTVDIYILFSFEEKKNFKSFDWLNLIIKNSKICN